MFPREKIMINNKKYVAILFSLSKLRILPEYGTPQTQIHVSGDQSPLASQHCHEEDKHSILLFSKRGLPLKKPVKNVS